jgi:hypothetical protein
MYEERIRFSSGHCSIVWERLCHCQAMQTRAIGTIQRAQILARMKLRRLKLFIGSERNGEDLIRVYHERT